MSSILRIGLNHVLSYLDTAFDEKGVDPFREGLFLDVQVFIPQRPNPTSFEIVGVVLGAPISPVTHRASPLASVSTAVGGVLSERKRMGFALAPIHRLSMPS